MTDMDMTQQRTFAPYAIVLLMIPLIALALVLAYLNHSNYDPFRMIGCYRSANTPLVRVAEHEVSFPGSPFPAVPSRLTSNNQGYAVRLSHGLVLVRSDGELRPQASDRVIALPVSFDHNPPKLTMQTDQYELISLDKTVCG